MQHQRKFLSPRCKEENNLLTHITLKEPKLFEEQVSAHLNIYNK